MIMPQNGRRLLCFLASCIQYRRRGFGSISLILYGSRDRLDVSDQQEKTFFWVCFLVQTLHRNVGFWLD